MHISHAVERMGFNGSFTIGASFSSSLMMSEADIVNTQRTLQEYNLNPLLTLENLSELGKEHQSIDVVNMSFMFVNESLFKLITQFTVKIGQECSKTSLKCRTTKQNK